MQPIFLRVQRAKYQKGTTMRIYSEQFNRYYNSEDVVNLVNTKQAGLYIKNGSPLVDIFWSRDSLVFVFNKIQSFKAYELWCDHKLA